jgi:transposase
MNDAEGIERRFALLSPALDERARRLVVAAESLVIGRGGAVAVAGATGVSRRVIAQGMRELRSPGVAPSAGIRQPGGGRKRTVSTDPTLRSDLERLVDPVTRGDPESPLRWTCKSVRTLADELERQGHRASHRLVAELLHDLGYSLQANRKTHEGGDHPEHINRQVEAALAQSEPAISVDTKKKELVGDFKNGGRELRPKGDPERVRMHDFPIKELGKVNPYGVYDLARNAAWVSVGTDHDTAGFAVESIRRWWHSMGSLAYPHATRLLITADGGGSNGARARLWKVELQRLADETALQIVVCHLPPGTSKWNKIEHRLFSFISQNWRGKPLVSHEVILNLIAATTTTTGLAVRCQLDTNTYPAGVKVPDHDMEALHIEHDAFHGEWNYTILPSTAPPNETFIP